MREVSLKSPEAQRAGAEENLWRSHGMNFGTPLRVNANIDEHNKCSSYSVSVRQPDYRQARKTLENISPDECLYSCNKDVAIYLNPPATNKFRNGRSFFDTVYYYFFPHRDLALDISGSHFFSQLIDFKPHDGGGTLSDVINFHETLCKKVEAEIPKLNQTDTQPTNKFGLSPTFSTVFLIVDGDVNTKEPDVLVVCKDAGLAQRLNFTDEDIERNPSAGSMGKTDPNTDSASLTWPFRYRVGLIQFMNALFALDEKRRIGVQPDSLFWKCQISEEMSQGTDFQYVS
jgi:hypothetical protein